MKFTISILIAASFLCSPSVASAVIIGPGDIVAPQSDNFGTVIVIHPTTHQRETLSLAPNIGTGPSMSTPESILRLPNGDFLVADPNGLFEVSSITGNRTIVSSPTVGTGNWAYPFTDLMTSSGDVICVFYNFVARVNLTTGDRTLISGLGVGTGPAITINGAGGATLDQLGHVVIASYEDRTVYDVNLATGTRSILSDSGHGGGPAISYLLDVVTLPNGQIVSENRNLDAGTNDLIRIDPVTGNRTLISSGSNEADNEYERLALGTDGRLLGSVPSNRSLYSVDPTNGARTLISGPSLGSGPSLFWGDMVQIPVPEPASAGSLAAGATFLLAMLYLRRRSNKAGANHATNAVDLLSP